MALVRISHPGREPRHYYIKNVLSLLTKPMKKIFTSSIFTFLFSALAVSPVSAQGWPADYDGVMLQAFSWDDYTNTRWTVLEKQADELSRFFSLVWVPQSGNCGGTSMGYNPLYYFDQNSSFGKEAALRSMIQTFKDKGIGTIADVVINHRQNVSSWVDFPAETYKGVTYQMKSTDICADDDGGKAKEWADKNGFELSPNKDSGEGWDGFRDIDHASENVQTIIKAYEDFLLNDLGYTGFRYDVGKGFDAKYFGMYNEAAKPQFSVGEVWDSNAVIKKWIDGTNVGNGIQSGAFDFQFRYAVRDALNNSNKMSSMKNDCLMRSDDYKRYAVTFVENHDMQDRGNVTNYQKDPINKNVIQAANAAMLTMPGTPCVFLPHWLEYKAQIKQMIDARKVAGITNTSSIEELYSDNTAYIYKSGSLLCMIGGAKSSYADGYQLIMNGNRYYIYLAKSAEMPWISVSSSEYAHDADAQSVKLTAVSASDAAKLVYTTDGSEPSATNGTVVESGASIEIAKTTTLKVGLLVNDEVKNVQTRQYTWLEEVVIPTTKATMHVCNESGALNPLYIYIWAGPENEQINGGWPGKEAKDTEEIGGKTWYVQSFDIPTSGEEYVVNFVFTTKGGGTQTVNVEGMTQDTYYIINKEQSGGKYTVTNVTDQYSAIESVIVDLPQQDALLFDLQGRPSKTMNAGQLYIRAGQKLIVR